MTEFYIVTPVRTVCNKRISLLLSQGEFKKSRRVLFSFFFSPSAKWTPLPLSTGSGWMKLTYCVAAQIVPRFWIHDLNSIKNSLVFWLLLNSACYTAPRLFLFLTVPLFPWWVGWRWTKKLQEDMAITDDLKWPKGYSVPYDIEPWNKSSRKGRGMGDIIGDFSVCLPKLLSYVPKPCLPGSGWTSASCWEAAN